MVGAERKAIQLNQPTFKLFNELFLFSRKTIFQALAYFARFYYIFKNKETVIIAVYKRRNDTKRALLVLLSTRKQNLHKWAFN